MSDGGDVWQMSAGELFTKYDVDKDGSVEIEEFKHLTTDYLKGVCSSHYAPDVHQSIFESADTDKNGQLSLEEFTVAVGKLSEIRQAHQSHH